jgi:hypothetical protein
VITEIVEGCPNFKDMSDPEFKRQVQRLHEFNVYRRWLIVIVSWLTLGVYSLWTLREDIELLREHFTWAAVRFGLGSNRLAAICLGFCVGLTTAVLLGQSRNILLGLPEKERQQLEAKVRQIRAQGASHPLWKWISR